jgi:hypothetical protein
MAWRYYHNGTPASAERPLTNEERVELHRISRRSTFFCAWPLAVTAATSLYLASTTKQGDLWFVAALLPFLVFGLPAAMHSYQLFRDRGLAREGVLDGSAITVSLEGGTESLDQVVVTTTGFVLGAKRTFFRYTPPLSIAKVAIAEPSDEPTRLLTDEETEELTRRSKFKLTTTDCCCAPLILLPFLFLTGGEWVAVLAFILGVVGVAGTVLLIRDSAIGVRHCRAALRNPVVSVTPLDEDWDGTAEILSAGQLCWTFQGEPAYWRTYGGSPHDLVTEIIMRDEDEDD